MATKERLLFKDEILDELAQKGNVAQFVSFGPGKELPQRHSRVLACAPNHKFESAKQAIQVLLERSPERMVNIRTYRPESPEGNPFIRKLESMDDAYGALIKHSELGLYTIVNETINESDGGVSGVCHAGQLEFAPDTTPRCVDDPKIRTAKLPFEFGSKVLQLVYGFTPDVPGAADIRTEFSIHPRRRGWRDDHTIIWQQERAVVKPMRRFGSWPNAFSRMVGDKVYGLLVAASVDLPVPRTNVYTRRLFPFTFGLPTGSARIYTRTAPEEKAPGYYPSSRGWVDPFKVLADHRVLSDRGYQPLVAPSKVPDDIRPLASVLSQEEVEAKFSGRLVYGATDAPLIDGVRGGGEHFMLGAGRSGLPSEISAKVENFAALAREKLGMVEFEWVYDGQSVWVVQLHRSKRNSSIVLAREDLEWIDFVYEGPHMIEDFRALARSLKGKRKGINVVGNSSPLSHLGEIALHYSVPARFED